MDNLNFDEGQRFSDDRGGQDTSAPVGRVGQSGSRRVGEQSGPGNQKVGSDADPDESSAALRNDDLSEQIKGSDADYDQGPSNASEPGNLRRQSADGGKGDECMAKEQ